MVGLSTCASSGRRCQSTPTSQPSPPNYQPSLPNPFRLPPPLNPCLLQLSPRQSSRPWAAEDRGAAEEAAEEDEGLAKAKEDESLAKEAKDFGSEGAAGLSGCHASEHP